MAVAGRGQTRRVKAANDEIGAGVSLTWLTREISGWEDRVKSGLDAR